MFSECISPKTKIKNKKTDAINGVLYFLKRFNFSLQFQFKNQANEIRSIPTEVANLETGILAERPKRPT